MLFTVILKPQVYIGIQFLLVCCYILGKKEYALCKEHIPSFNSSTFMLKHA